MTDEVNSSPRAELLFAAEDQESSTKPQSDFFLCNPGYCVTCDQQVTFLAKDSWLRDYYLCSECGSIPRERAIMLAIERFFPSWRDLRIHESSPGQRGASAKLMRNCKDYTGTHFYETLQPGETHESGWRNENLEQQTFIDESFDLVISQDVMEHLFRPDLAIREIARTLKPGGAYVFTAPLVRKHLPTRARATRGKDGLVSYLLPPEYHGNPINEAGSLVTTDWGYDICDFIHSYSGLSTTIMYVDDLSLGIRAEYIEVLIARKRIESAFDAIQHIPALSRFESWSSRLGRLFGG